MNVMSFLLEEYMDDGLVLSSDICYYHFPEGA